MVSRSARTLMVSIRALATRLLIVAGVIPHRMIFSRSPHIILCLIQIYTSCAPRFSEPFQLVHLSQHVTRSAPKHGGSLSTIRLDHALCNGISTQLAVTARRPNEPKLTLTALLHRGREQCPLGCGLRHFHWSPNERSEN